MAKQRLPLLDEALQQTHYPAPDAGVFPYRHVREIARRASRFVFDTEASTYLGRMIYNCGGEILHNRQFAIPPTDPCYVEFDIDAMMTEIPKPSWQPNRHNENRDQTVGYLMSGSRVYECFRSVSGSKGSFGPWSFDLASSGNTERLFSDSWEGEMTSRLAMLLGGTFHKAFDGETLTDILNTTRINFHIPPGKRTKAVLSSLLPDIAGTLRNAWAALLLLNQNRGVTMHSVGPRAAIVGGKRHVFSRHKVVSISLCPVPEMRKRLLSGRRESPAAHTVRGHFAHWHLGAGCEHRWPMMPDLDHRWTCEACGGIRRWRSEHVRGDASKGFITHDYNVGV